ncbi:MAG: hypothetical protein ACRDHL_00990 [Candidatus Promineifilaceae bacterium]
MTKANPVRRLALAAGLLIALLLAACQQESPAGPTPALDTPAASPSPPIEDTPLPTAAPTQTGSEPPIDPALTEPIRQEIAGFTGLPLDAVVVESAEALASPDLCLGVQVDEQPCYEVTLSAQGVEYVYVVGGPGQHRNVSDAIYQAGPGQIGLTWGTDECLVAAMPGPAQPVGVGGCQSEFLAYDFAQPAEVMQPQLDELLAGFAPFEAVTAAGHLSFQGSGSAEATPAQQRLIAEWAQYVAETAVAGQDDLAQRRALSWQRVGGIAGFCHTVLVYETGLAEAYNECEGEPRGAPYARDFLSAELAASFYAWLDALAPAAFEQSDGDVADAMTIRVEFQGQGEATISEAQQQELVRFGNDVWVQLGPAGAPTSFFFAPTFAGRL